LALLEGGGVGSQAPWLGGRVSQNCLGDDAHIRTVDCVGSGLLGGRAIGANAGTWSRSRSRAWRRCLLLLFPGPGFVTSLPPHCAVPCPL